MTEFLTKSPDVALVEIKEKLYDRLNILKQCIGPNYDHGDPVDRQMNNEIQFLERLLDTIERS